MQTDVHQLNTELQRHTDTLASLSKQMKLMRHVPLEVASLRDDVLNIVAQFPAGNTHDVKSLRRTVSLLIMGLINRCLCYSS